MKNWPLIKEMILVAKEKKLMLSITSGRFVAWMGEDGEVHE